MFKHILIPTDGSKLAAKGVRAGVKLARALGARVTAVHVMPPYVPPFGDAVLYVPAKKILALAEREAGAAASAG